MANSPIDDNIPAAASSNPQFSSPPTPMLPAYPGTAYSPPTSLPPAYSAPASPHSQHTSPVPFMDPYSQTQPAFESSVSPPVSRSRQNNYGHAHGQLAQPAPQYPPHYTPPPPPQYIPHNGQAGYPPTWGPPRSPIASPMHPHQQAYLQHQMGPVQSPPPPPLPQQPQQPQQQRSPYTNGYQNASPVPGQYSPYPQYPQYSYLPGTDIDNAIYAQYQQPSSPRALQERQYQNPPRTDGCCQQSLLHQTPPKGMSSSPSGKRPSGPRQILWKGESYVNPRTGEQQHVIYSREVKRGSHRAEARASDAQPTDTSNENIYQSTVAVFTALLLNTVLSVIFIGLVFSSSSIQSALSQNWIIGALIGAGIVMISSLCLVCVMSPFKHSVFWTATTVNACIVSGSLVILQFLVLM